MSTRTRKGVAIGLLAAIAAIGVAAVMLQPAERAGKAMPDFDLFDVDSQRHTLAANAGKVVVINFSSQECPFSRGADPVFQAAVDKFAPQGVVFYSIDSHNATTPEQMKAYAAEHKLTAHFLKDAANHYADAASATRTPEVFVLDRELRIAFHGAMDNRWAPETKGDVNYLDLALSELLAGKPVSKPEVMAWGCSIKRTKG